MTPSRRMRSSNSFISVSPFCFWAHSTKKTAVFPPFSEKSPCPRPCFLVQYSAAATVGKPRAGSRMLYGKEGLCNGSQTRREGIPHAHPGHLPGGRGRLLLQVPQPLQHRRRHRPGGHVNNIATIF